MTKMEKLQEALGYLFDDPTVADDILEHIANEPTTFCSICKYSDECDRAYFVTDENGDFVLDKDGDRISNADESGWSCEGILRKHLDEEV